MGNKAKIILFLFLIFLGYAGAAQEQRFPKPEFETGYVQPSPTTPEPRDAALEFLDVLILIVVLSLASWFALQFGMPPSCQSLTSLSNSRIVMSEN